MNCLLTETQAAKFLGLSVKSLQCWRWRKIGPRYLKMNGGAVRYQPEDLTKFVAASVVETRDSGKPNRA